MSIVVDITDHEHCYKAGACWQDREPCPALSIDPEDRHDGRSEPTQCGTCLHWWDDAVITSMTPTPAGRCPFEYDHEDV